MTSVLPAFEVFFYVPRRIPKGTFFFETMQCIAGPAVKVTCASCVLPAKPGHLLGDETTHSGRRNPCLGTNEQTSHKKPTVEPS